MGHIHSMYDLTVAALIVYEDQLLLLFHKKLQSWMYVGGHVELNEDPEMALWREIHEETGLTQRDLQLIQAPQERPQSLDLKTKALPFPFDLSVYPSGALLKHRHIELSYLIRSKTPKVVLNKQESLDLRWFSLEDIQSMRELMFPNVYAQSTFALSRAKPPGK